MIRRSFLRALVAGLGAALVVRGTAAAMLARGLQSAGATDREIALRIFSMAARRGLQTDPVGEIMVAIGSSFTGTPYLAHGLEVQGPERLVVNLRGFDCTTFVESVLALSRCVKLGTATFEAFRQELQTLRYRAGVIRGYPSRLHYFIDWIADNEEKHLVRDLTGQLGGAPVTRPINFMTSHRQLYAQLTDEGNAREVAETERRLSGRPYAVLARQQVAAVQDRLQNGDIIAFATPIAGLDVTHMGMAVRSGRVVRLLHAPLSDGNVQLSGRSLPDYVAALGKATGILVARPVNP
jgi:cell wall-associated NlpC family hydrolase